MIFKSISQISNKIEKNFFLEQIQVFIRLVEVFCEKNSCSVGEADADMLLDEFIKIGVISYSDELAVLEKNIGNLYTPFVNAVGFAATHKEKVGTLLSGLYNSERKIKQEEDKTNTRHSLVDFFCGAGGLSLGFLQEGFRVKLANDIEDVCIQTYKYNHPELPSSKLIQGDIKQIIDNIGDYLEEDIDIVVGGPPCQGFSEANRQRVIDDPRNKLYKYFIKAVETIAPKMVVMENVRGMYKVSGQVLEDFAMIRAQKNGKVYSYQAARKMLNSQYFSVAQSRERLIYVAIRDDVISNKGISPERIFDEIDDYCEGRKQFTLQDALNDIKPLDAPRVKNTNEIDSESTGKKIDVNYYDNNCNDYLTLINQGRKIPFVFNHKARYVSDINYDIYRLLEPGDDATDPKIADIMPYAHRNHCFKDKYYKLRADRPCRTITAHLRMDCHSHIHPYQIRAITPREAARVQSFPDDYLFWGAYLKTYMQIGNAVPPVMARGIAYVLKKYL